MEITPEMEIVRERVLSLIPKKEDGKFAHGALKEFANSIGLKSGNLISDWINLRSHSYMNYLYEIAAKYNVSVEWLKGETDEKNPPPKGEGIPHAALREYLVGQGVRIMLDADAKVTEQTIVNTVRKLSELQEKNDK